MPPHPINSMGGGSTALNPLFGANILLPESAEMNNSKINNNVFRVNYLCENSSLFYWHLSAALELQ
jgi:hypothetical protein